MKYLLVLSDNQERILCCIEAEQEQDAWIIATSHPIYSRKRLLYTSNPWIYHQDWTQLNQGKGVHQPYKIVPEITITIKHNDTE